MSTNNLFWSIDPLSHHTQSLGIKDGSWRAEFSSLVLHFSISDYPRSLAPLLVMHQFTFFTVLSVLSLSVLASPMPLDNPLNKRSYTGHVRRLLGSPLCPHTDHWPPREHGSTMVWVHAVNGTSTPILLPPFQSPCMAQEATVAE